MSSSKLPDANPTTIDCVTAVRRLWDYLDGRLSVVAREEVEAHLAICEKCPPHFMFAERMKRTLAESGAVEMSTDEVTRLRGRVRGALARFALEKDSRD